MLGSCLLKSQEYTINDFQTEHDYLDYMYRNIKGCIAVGTIDSTNEYTQVFHRNNALIQKPFKGRLNTYVSMNTFTHNSRTVDHLKRLNACYVDIDCYKEGLSKEAVLYALENDYFNTKIPTPTFVIDSGRGLYLIWKLRNEDKNALPRWQTVQNYLFEMCKDLGADPLCTDGSRILRVPTSINSKSGTPVTILRFYDLAYSIYEITEEFDIKAKTYQSYKKQAETHPYGQATEKMRKYARVISEQTGLNLPDFNSYEETFLYIKINKLTKETRKYNKNLIYFNTSNVKPFLNGRCKDLEILYKTRKGANCKREVALFLYRLWQLEMTGDSQLALERTLAFNATLDAPFTEKYVSAKTKSAETKIKKGETYKYTKERIIRDLEITDDEMELLTYLTPSCSKKSCNRKAYLSRLEKEGKKTKKESKAERNALIVDMLNKGMSAKEIYTSLNISRATYQRALASIKVADVIKDVAESVEQLVEGVKEEVTSNKKENTTREITADCDVSFFQSTNYISSLLPHVFLVPTVCEGDTS